MALQGNYIALSIGPFVGTATVLPLLAPSATIQEWCSSFAAHGSAVAHASLADVKVHSSCIWNSR